MFKAQFQLIRGLHGCTVFPAMVLREHGLVLLLRFGSTMPGGSHGHGVCNSSVNRHKIMHPSHFPIDQVRQFYAEKVIPYLRQKINY